MSADSVRIFGGLSLNSIGDLGRIDISLLKLMMTKQTKMAPISQKQRLLWGAIHVLALIKL